MMVMAMIAPSSPAAYCRTEPEPFGGGGPGSYVDFSMFCFHIPSSRSTCAVVPCARTTLEHKIKPVIGQTIGFDDIPVAIQAMADRRTIGRTIVLLDA